jgi:7,8-didemethyl-8-hydroxy-5-deazariboflavin synthase CofH subunit
MKLRRAIDDALDGKQPSLAGATTLLEARGSDLETLRQAADALRIEQVGDRVTYVVNRNINFTNVCIKRCHFCAFSDDLRTGSGYFLPLQEVVRRAEEARAMGATEICIQAGLAPELDARSYLAITEAVKTAVPELHLHAWSPEEIKHGAKQSQLSIKSFLADLKSAGLDSLPGTSAEILDDALRRRLAVGRITSAQWLEVVRSAHELELPTTSTMMFGHLETAQDQAGHLLTLRHLQSQTGGFTEFVPLAFVHADAPLFSASSEVRPGPSAEERRAVYAASRLILGSQIKNLQVSWVKEGMAEAKELLRFGVNDLGGTLINESISTSAGAPHGQRQSPQALAELIVSAGRQAQQRNTLYQAIEARPAAPWRSDYGSWQELRDDERFAYKASGKPSRSAAVSTSQASPRR